MLTGEELADLMPEYRPGRRPRPSATVRRLAPCLELVERGPNRSLTRGARYRIVASRLEPPPPPVEGDEDEGWIDEALSRRKR